MQTKSSAFTLIELLVTITIILVLAGIAMSGMQTARKSAEKIREVAAAKTLITAYTQAANDRDGTFLPGYDRTSNSLTLSDGQTLSGPPAQRYPYRLAPYFNNKMDGVILVNNNARQVAGSDTYSISCFPAFGINYIYVGGDFSSSGAQTYPDECVTRPANAASVLVFASAAGSPSSESNKTISGYCILTPPRIQTTMWSNAAWDKNSNPGSYGQVDARYGGKAVCAFLDGSTRLLTIDELRDMRLWNYNAAAQHNAGYNIVTAAPTGR